MGFVSCALKGFEKEKIEGLIGYGFQKEKRKRNIDLCYGFYALKGIDDLGWLC